MFDLDMQQQQRRDVVELLNRFDTKTLTAKSSRLFILALSEITEDYMDEISESVDENVEACKIGFAVMLDDAQQRRIGIELETNAALVEAVQTFIKTKLHDLSEWEE